MNTTHSQLKISILTSLLERSYELVEYTRSKHDTAPIALGYDNDPGHVHNDRAFCEKRDRLKEDVRRFIETEWGVIEYNRFQSHLEHITPVVPPGHSPGYKGLLRCRCWWDAKDELQAIAEYLYTLKSELEKSNNVIVTQNKSSDRTAPSKHTPWLSGSFYLLALVIVFVLLIVTYQTVGVVGLPIVIIGALLLISVVGAFQLRQDDALSQKNFLNLMLLVFRQIPLLMKRDQNTNGKDE